MLTPDLLLPLFTLTRTEYHRSGGGGGGGHGDWTAGRAQGAAQRQSSAPGAAGGAGGGRGAARRLGPAARRHAPTPGRR